jgi:hypothetical protein
MQETQTGFLERFRVIVVTARNLFLEINDKQIMRLDLIA